jgi:hypothetical protein
LFLFFSPERDSSHTTSLLIALVEDLTFSSRPPLNGSHLLPLPGNEFEDLLVDLFPDPSDLLRGDVRQLHKVGVGGSERRREEEWIRERRKEGGEMGWSGKIGRSTV